MDESRPTRIALRHPSGAERQESPPGARAVSLGGAIDDVEEDVEVAHGAEESADGPEVGSITQCRIALEPIPEDAPGRAHPPRGDAHRVELLRILAGHRARDADEHPREVEPEHLAPGLGPRVAAVHAG